MLLKLRFAILGTLTLFAATANAANTLTVGVGYTYSTIQSAINAAIDGDTVAVYGNNAIYYENIDFKGKAITVTRAGMGLVIISGSGSGPTVSMIGPFGSSPGFPVLQNFLIQGGGLPQTAGGAYGGIYIANAGTVTLQGNSVEASACTGIVSINAEPNLISNEVASTTAPSGCPAGEGKGSAIFVSGGPGGLIMGGQLHNNTASVAASDNGGGAGINLLNVPYMQIANNSIFNNTSTGYGGGIYAGNSPALYITGNLIYNNKGISGGMDLVIPGSSVGPIAGVIANNTLAANTGSGANSASDLYLGGNLAQYVVINNIVEGYANGQTALNCGSQYAKQTITPLVFDHNDILAYAGTTAIAIGGACASPTGTFGNISVDPQFTLATPAALAAGTADFHLAKGSPAIDTGSNAVYDLARSAVPNNDIDNNVRPQDATSLGYQVIDMGAYELPGASYIKEPVAPAVLLTPSTYNPQAGSMVTLAATVYVPLGTPATGTVSFYEDNTLIGTVAIPSTTITAAFSILPQAAGLHSFFAVYSGVTPGATSPQLYLLVTAAKTTSTNTTLTSSLNPSDLGQSVTFTAHVTATDNSIPTGTINFTDGVASLGPQVTIDASGNATLSISALAAGSHALVASYVPAAPYAGSNGSLTQVVYGPLASAVLSVNPASAGYGAPVTLTATISPANPPGPAAPTGSVEFFVDGGLQGTVTVTPSNSMQSVASEILSTLPAGYHSLTCQYLGNYEPTSCNTVLVDITAVASTLTLTSSLNPAPALAPVTFTMHVTANGQPAPAGIAIQLLDIGCNNALASLLATVTTDANGSATFTTSSLTVGTHCLAASSAATASLGIGNASLMQVITPAIAGLSLTSSMNPAYFSQAVTFTVAATGAPGVAVTGTVMLYDNTTLLGTASLNAGSQAIFTFNNLTVGAHPIGYTFIGTGAYSFLAQSLAPLQQVILPSSFSLSLAPATLTIAPGHSGNTQIILTSIGAYTGPLTLTYGQLPTYATATLNTTTVTLPAGGAVAATLQISTATRVDNVIPRRPGSRRLPIALATSLLLLLPLRRRKRVTQLLTLYLATALVPFLTGCTNTYYAEPTVAPGTYQLPITATDANHTTQTAILTVTVP